MLWLSLYAKLQLLDFQVALVLIIRLFAAVHRIICLVEMLEHQERCQICGFRPPRYFWFVVSGFVCDMLQAVLDYIISIVYTLQWERITVCWTVSYILSIWIRHFSHKMLVFGDYEGSYLASLGRTYLTYSASIVLSIVTNYALVQHVGLAHKQAWVVTMLWTGRL